MLPENSKSICKKCSHFPSCTTPCYPITRYLHEPGEVYERNAVVYPLHRQVQQSACLKPSDDGKEIANSSEKIFSDELESPFRNFSNKMMTTGIFIDRFFFRENYKDIAMKFGISESGARVLYSNAVQKILENLELLDQDGRKDIASIHYKKVFRKKAKAIPKNKRWWILCNYFGMTPQEVAEMDRTTNRNVSAAVCRFNAQVKAGKVVF